MQLFRHIFAQLRSPGSRQARFPAEIISELSPEQAEFTPVAKDQIPASK
jgi:hypothetical protein